jgi:hypothetical protein
MILQCDDRQLRAGLARRRATKVSNYKVVHYKENYFLCPVQRNGAADLLQL